MDTSQKRIRPVEGEWFRVDPLRINRNLFEAGMWHGDEQCKALNKIKFAYNALPDKPDYSKPFEILIPKKTWDPMPVTEILQLCRDFGGTMSTGVETAFMWAQIIDNGELPRDLCDELDNLENYRLVIWDDGFIHFTGGARNGKMEFSATHIDSIPILPTFMPSNAVPQITRRLK